MTKNPVKTKLDVILHPVRMRIVMALSGQEMTPQQLAELLHDVPQATLYRHINLLADAGFLAVAEERPVRGVTEKVYRVETGPGTIDPSELAGISKEDHLRYFTAFIANLLDSFSRYLQAAEQVDYLHDGVGYRAMPIELSDEELTEMSIAINAAILPYLDNRPAPGRKRRILASVMLPDVDAPAVQEKQE